MNAIGIDVSKGKSTAAVLRPFGEIVIPHSMCFTIQRPLRSLSHSLKVYMLKNNLISLFDQTFPNANSLLTSPARKDDGREKWIDITLKYPHAECISKKLYLQALIFSFLIITTKNPAPKAHVAPTPTLPKHPTAACGAELLLSVLLSIAELLSCGCSEISFNSKKIPPPFAKWKVCVSDFIVTSRLLPFAYIVKAYGLSNFTVTSGMVSKAGSL